MYASSVSPLSSEILERLGGGLLDRLGFAKEPAGKDLKTAAGGKTGKKAKDAAHDFTNSIKISNEVFEIENIKGKKRVILPWERLSRIKDETARLASSPRGDALLKGLKGCVTVGGKYRLLEGEKLKLILRLSGSLEADGALKRTWPRKKEFSSAKDLPALLDVLPLVLAPALWKSGKNDLGFICLSSNGAGLYRLNCSRGFHTALNESLSSVESLIDDLGEDVSVDDKNIVNRTFRRLSDYVS
jgi:hypothetical protein